MASTEPLPAPTAVANPTDEKEFDSSLQQPSTFEQPSTNLFSSIPTDPSAAIAPASSATPNGQGFFSALTPGASESDTLQQQPSALVGDEQQPNSWYRNWIPSNWSAPKVELPSFEAPTFASISSNVTDNSGSWIVKVAFVGVIIIIFYIILKILFYVAYNIKPPSNSVIKLVSGALDGTQSVPIVQDATKNPTKYIRRSSDGITGIEYTYSTWIFLNNITGNNGYVPIFIKGTQPSSTSGVDAVTTIENIENGPGVYAFMDMTGQSSTVNLMIVTDTFGSSTADQNTTKSLREMTTIANVPVGQWFHLVIRLQNISVDVYINGVIVTRTNLSSTPLQNNSDFYVFPSSRSGGSYISNLTYYPNALTVYQINAITLAGPSTSPSEYTKSNLTAPPSSFLSTLWYSGQTAPMFA